ncbi:MAG: hypothetical protein EOO65_02795 [Methanosarcinales archaeon]|nr:MAG: hypothetical protein EOO65_02795 [Methanosarcinales archaeon]
MRCDSTQLASPLPSVQMSEGVLNLVKALSRRLCDTNANLKPRACAALASLARAVGASHIHPAFRFTSRNLLDMLSDKRHQGAAVAAMDAWVVDARRGKPVAVSFAAVVRRAICATMCACKRQTVTCVTHLCARCS